MDKITGTVKLANVNGTAQIMFKKRSDFPASGRASAEYVANDENKIYRYDKAAGKYVCIGTNPDGLQKQIDNIVIAGTGSGDAAAEVAQARVNANGTTFETLKERTDNDFNVLNNKFEANISNIRKNIEEIIYNLFDKNTATMNGYINPEGTWVDDASFYESDFIKVEYGETYSLNSGYTQFIVYYDEDRNFIGASEQVQNGIFTVDNADAYYVRFYGHKIYIGTDMFVKGSVYPSTYISYDQNVINNGYYTAYDANQRIRGNIFDKKKALSGCLINPNGDISINKSYYVSDFIEVNRNTDYCIPMDYTQDIHFYDSNKKWIGKVYVNQTGWFNITDPRIKYVRFFGNASKIETDMLVVGKEYPSTYMHFNDSIEEKTKCIEIDDTRTNLFNKATVTKGYIVNEKGEMVTTTNETDTFYASDFIKVEYGKAYAINKTYTQNIPMYDENKNFISSTEILTNGKFVVSETNAKYIRFYGVNRSINSDMMVEGYSYPTEYIPYGIQHEPIKKWKGKKWTAMGDSLTEVNYTTSMRYHDYIKLRTGIEVVNCGVGGTGYMETYIEGTLPFYERIDTIPIDSDVVTIFGSVNDMSRPLGNVSDTGTSTLCGCINTTIDRIYERMPVVNLGIITPVPSSAFNPATANNAMEKYSNALITICKNRGIPCLDLYHQSNLRPWDTNASILQFGNSVNPNGDGVHPNELGHKFIASRIENFMNSLIN